MLVGELGAQCILCPILCALVLVTWVDLENLDRVTWQKDGSKVVIQCQLLTTL